MEKEKCHCEQAKESIQFLLDCGPKNPRYINGQKMRLSLIEERCECRNDSARLKPRRGATETHMDILVPNPIPVTDPGTIRIPSSIVTNAKPGVDAKVEWETPKLLENKSAPTLPYSGPGSWGRMDCRGTIHWRSIGSNVELKDSLENVIAQFQLDPIAVIPVANNGEVDSEGFEKVFPIGFELMKYKHFIDDRFIIYAVKFRFNREWNGQVTKTPVEFRYTNTGAVDREFELTGVDPFQSFGSTIGDGIPDCASSETVNGDLKNNVETTGELSAGSGTIATATPVDEDKESNVHQKAGRNEEASGGTSSDSDEESESEGKDKGEESMPDVSEGMVVQDAGSDGAGSNPTNNEILTYTQSAYNTNVECECRVAALEAFKANERFWEAFAKCAHGKTKKSEQCTCRQFRSHYDKLLIGETMMPRIKVGSGLVRNAFQLYRKAFKECAWCQEEGFKKPYPKM